MIPSKRRLPSYGGIFDWDTAKDRLDEMNRRAEDPNLWEDPKRAQKVMRERQTLERAINSYESLERDLDDCVTLIELGETENALCAPRACAASDSATARCCVY